MSKLLAVIISFALVVTSLTAHVVVPVSAAEEADFSKSHAIHGCYAGTLFSAFENYGDTGDENLLPGEPHHCLLDFVIVMAPTSNH